MTGQAVCGRGKGYINSHHRCLGSGEAAVMALRAACSGIEIIKDYTHAPDTRGECRVFAAVMCSLNSKIENRMSLYSMYLHSLSSSFST